MDEIKNFNQLPPASKRPHVAQHSYFNPECECLVVFILNTRKKIKGHYVVSIGTMDTILCHAREVFRLAIMASAAVIIIAHNHVSLPRVEDCLADAGNVPGDAQL